MGKTVQLLIGDEICEMLVKDEAAALRESIAKLRKESFVNIPPVHITDEVKIDESGYVIRIDGNTVLRSNLAGKNENYVINNIINDLEFCCKTYM